MSATAIEIENSKILAGVLRAEAKGEDLKMDTDGLRVYVCLEDENGDSRVMGSIDASLRHSDPEGFRICVSKIKFSYGSEA